MQQVYRWDQEGWTNEHREQWDPGHYKRVSYREPRVIMLYNSLTMYCDMERRGWMRVASIDMIVYTCLSGLRTPTSPPDCVLTVLDVPQPFSQYRECRYIPG